MRKPLVVLGLAAVTLASGGCATRASAHEPPNPSESTTTADIQWFEPAPQAPGDAPAAGWGGAPAPSTPAVSRSVLALTRAQDEQDPTRRAAREPADSDPIAASRTAVTAASASPGVQAPVQQQVLALVNRNRRQAGCDPVTLDRRLIEAANRHAADMARRDYFDHDSPRGADAGDRVTDAGYVWRRYGENIAKGQDSPYEVMAAWMSSPGHRQNILDCRLDQMGVGLALSADRTPYWVQDFATPRN